MVSTVWKELIGEVLCFAASLLYKRQTSFNVASQCFVDSGSQVANRGRQPTDSIKILENALGMELF